MSHQVGDFRIATLTVTPHDGSTAAVLTVTSPSGATSTPVVTESPSGTWTSAAYALSAAGRWVEKWTVTGTGQGVETSVLLVSALPTPALPALCDITDLEDRLGRSLTTVEQSRAAAYLFDASALVRQYTKQTFTTVNNDTVKLRPVGAFLQLKQLPVISVTSVAGIDVNGMPGAPISGWAFDGIDKIDIAGVGFGWLADPWWPWPYGPDSFQVVYSHGAATAPDDVIAVVCGMVLRVLLAPSQTEGMSAEHIGQYSYQMSQQVGGGSAGVTVRLSEQDKEALSNYRPKAGSIQVRL